MERENVKQLLMKMEVTFPNFNLKAEELEFTLNAWYEMLQDYNDVDVAIAYKTYITTNCSPFAPSVSQIIGLIHKTDELADIQASEAWAKVRVAIGKSGYNSKAEFEKLPEPAQKAIGSAEQLHFWATDDSFNENVVMSLFMKNYNAVLSRNAEERKLPKEAKLRLAEIRRQALIQQDGNTFLLGQKPDKLQEGDFDYSEERPDAETVGHYAQQLRERLGNE